MSCFGPSKSFSEEYGVALLPQWPPKLSIIQNLWDQLNRPFEGNQSNNLDQVWFKAIYNIPDDFFWSSLNYCRGETLQSSKQMVVAQESETFLDL